MSIINCDICGKECNYTVLKSGLIKLSCGNSFYEAEILEINDKSSSENSSKNKENKRNKKIIIFLTVILSIIILVLFAFNNLITGITIIGWLLTGVMVESYINGTDPNEFSPTRKIKK